LLNVEINASLPQIEPAYKNQKLSLLYHPDRHDTDKDAWTAQFQILSTIMMMMSIIKARSQTLRNDKNTNVNPGGRSQCRARA
jgi:DnaJ-class molecular chaperone